ncbi:hypothetical protein ACQKP0_20545 [Heyndrickxia sp. NPDC080065]|uniref:hypothetical protein n=1 Tax=Heyndrickxia sp. NPDC080065 TaxID=3390568 RepID=UPI003CFC0CAE
MKDNSVRFKIIKELSVDYPVQLLSEFAGVSRSGHYKLLKLKNVKTPKQQED